MHSKSEKLFKDAQQLFSGGSTRATLIRRPHPLYVESGRGCRMQDVDGNVYVDFDNNFTSLIHGHAHPSIVNEVIEQAKRGTCFGAPTELELMLARLLKQRNDRFEKIRFCNTGTEAVMIAIKAARAYSGRQRVLKFEGAYHGWYDDVEVGLDSAPDTWMGRYPVPVRFNAGLSSSSDQTLVSLFNNAKVTEEIIARHHKEIACVLVDPIPSRAGLIPATVEFLRELRQICTSYGLVLISDEVLTYRLDVAGSMARYGVVPDMWALGKVIGGGFPIGAICGRAEIMSVFESKDKRAAVLHGGTFTANPMSMVAGMASLKLLDEDQTHRINELGDRARAALNAQFAAAGIPASITGCGSLLRLHLMSSAPSDYRSAYRDRKARDALDSIIRSLLAEGYYLPTTGMMAISSPMDDAVIDAAISTIFNSVASEYARQPWSASEASGHVSGVKAGAGHA